MSAFSYKTFGMHSISVVGNNGFLLSMLALLDLNIFSANLSPSSILSRLGSISTRLSEIKVFSCSVSASYSFMNST